MVWSSQITGHMRAFIAHIGHIQEQVLAELVLDVEVPVLNVRLILASRLHPVASGAVLEGRTERRGRMEVLREAVIHLEGGCDPIV